VAPQRARQLRRAIQYVHQDAATALDPWWSIGLALQQGLAIHGVRDAGEQRQRVAATPVAVGLDAAAARRYPHEFSGGQLRRTGAHPAAAAAGVDRGRADLRPRHVGVVLNLLLELRRRLSLTYLFISHAVPLFAWKAPI
jgi:ABC-type glutathione transport system ATPase component